MRIRKNVKLSLLLEWNGASRGKNVHVCELNQSPWDVIPFAQEPYPSYLHNQIEIEAEDNFKANGSLGDSIGVVESITSIMDGEDKAATKVDNMVIEKNDEVKTRKQFGFKTQCEEDNSNPRCSMTDKKARKNKKYMLPENRSVRARTANKGSLSASKSFEFYYYSGFGPSWGRRRGDIEIENNNDRAITSQNNMKPPSSSQFHNNKEIIYIDDDEESYDDVKNVDSGRKRLRKPTKKDR